MAGAPSPSASCWRPSPKPSHEVVPEHLLALGVVGDGEGANSGVGPAGECGSNVLLLLSVQLSHRPASGSMSAFRAFRRAPQPIRSSLQHRLVRWVHTETKCGLPHPTSSDPSCIGHIASRELHRRVSSPPASSTSAPAHSTCGSHGCNTPHTADATCPSLDVPRCIRAADLLPPHCESWCQPEHLQVRSSDRIEECSVPLATEWGIHICAGQAQPHISHCKRVRPCRDLRDLGERRGSQRRCCCSADSGWLPVGVTLAPTTVHP